jgi:hypothetical protein
MTVPTKKEINVQLPQRCEPLVKSFEMWAKMNNLPLTVVQRNGNFILKVESIAKLTIREVSKGVKH